MSRTPERQSAPQSLDGDSSGAHANGTDVRQSEYVAGWQQVNRLLRRGRSFSGRERNCCFLNTRDGRFADVSAIAGFDFADDARSVAICDWDQDGDLDIWLTNRTAPRLRFLKNEAPTKSHFVQFRLQGKSVNRDAIGARVSVTIGADDESRVISRSVRAGEGYLSQSTKRVHFGLGNHDRLAAITVCWPGGEVESFTPPAAVDQGFLLVEGSKVCLPQSTTVRDVALLPSDALPPSDGHFVEPSIGTAHNRLSEPLPLPSLKFELTDGTSGDLTDATNKPTLLNLWASWCPACVTELREWTQPANSERLEAHVNVVALAIDRLQPNNSAGEPDIEQLAAQTLPFSVGHATSDLVDRLQLVQNAIYDHEIDFPVPTSFLIDAQGRLTAIYKGPVSVDRIVADSLWVREQARDEADSVAAALPMPGRWIANPGPHQVRSIGQQLVTDGHMDDALEFASRFTATEHERRQQIELRMLVADHYHDSEDCSNAILQYDFILQLEPQSATALMKKGICLSKLDRLDEAVAALSSAVSLDGGDSSEAHVNYGIVLRKSGDLPRAVEQFRRAIEIDPSMTTAFTNLGLTLAAQTAYAAAAESLTRAVELEPNNTTRINLAIALEQIGQTDAGLEQLDEVIRVEPDSVLAPVYAAEFLANHERVSEAITYLDRAVQQKPRAAKLRFRLASLHELNRDSAAALSEYREAERLVRGDPMVQSRIAWILATSSDAAVRNGAEAVRLALLAARTTRRSDPSILDVLAAAYAETADFTMAIKVARDAIALARRSDDEALARKIEVRLTLYEAGKPVRSEK